MGHNGGLLAQRLGALGVELRPGHQPPRPRLLQGEHLAVVARAERHQAHLAARQQLAVDGGQYIDHNRVTGEFVVVLGRNGGHVVVVGDGGIPLLAGEEQRPVLSLHLALFAPGEQAVDSGLRHTHQAINLARCEAAYALLARGAGDEDVGRGVGHARLRVFVARAVGELRDAVADVLHLVANDVALLVAHPTDCLVLVHVNYQLSTKTSTSALPRP